MICSPALATKKIPTCTELLNIGYITDTSAALAVTIKDITTGRIEIIQGMSDNTGLVVIDLSDHKFSANHSYELFIFLAGGNYEDRQDIIVDGIQPYCTADLVQLDFEDVYENTDEQFSITSQTLECI